MAMIETTSLCRKFHVGDTWVHALDHVDLRIAEGDFVAVMGPSGSGKSTLMNILGCLDTPDGGHYQLLDLEVATLSDDELSRIRNQKIGFVFQSFHLLPRMTARENVLLPLRYSNADLAVARDRADDLLDRLGLADRLDHRPNQLSGGQRQRVAIARSLINAPPLLLADEPTGNLDPDNKQAVLDHLIDLCSRDQRMLLTVTHDHSLLPAFDRVVDMAELAAQSGTVA